MPKGKGSKVQSKSQGGLKEYSVIRRGGPCAAATMRTTILRCVERA